MLIVRGCVFPEELLYDVDNSVWLRPERDGTATLGLTSLAAALLGEATRFTPQKVGRDVQPNRAAATVEGAKAEMPLQSAVRGKIVAVNETVQAKPGLINRDPYGAGWLLRLEADNWEDVAEALLTGADVASAFEVEMERYGYEGR